MASAFYNISLATDLIEACERHLGPSGWDIEAVAKRASRAVGDTELEAAEMRGILGDMKKDLAGALESLRFYKQDQNLTRATMMLGFMVNGGILRIERFLSESG